MQEDDESTGIPSIVRTALKIAFFLILLAALYTIFRKLGVW